MKEEKKGITLISLVITIIILLILAGISINMLAGENGLLIKAKEAKEESAKAYYQDEIQLIIMEKQIEKSNNIDEKRELIELVEEGIKQKPWQESTTICDDEGNDKIEPKKGTKIIVQTKDGYEIIVKIDNNTNYGEIESIVKGTRKKWNITFDKNGGQGTEPENLETRFAITMPEGKTLSKSGYKFVGWSEDKNAQEDDEEKIYQALTTYMPTKDTTFYAIWSQVSNKITFDANGGEGSMDEINVLPENSTKIPKNAYTKEGWSFKEWNTKADNSGTKYDNEATIENLMEDITLYAIWEENINIALSVTDNKIIETSKISMGAEATTGVQKVELKVGENMLYVEQYNGSIKYEKNNLTKDNLDKIAFENLPFYKIGLEVTVTTVAGNTKTKTFQCQNYTIGNSNALEEFANVVDNGNSFSGETIYLLKDLYIEKHNPIGTWLNTETAYRFKIFFWNF